jgi:anti-sigma B factor antagonist
MDQKVKHSFNPEGELTIYTVAEHKARLMDALTNCGELEINLARVTEMDTAGLQLLMLAKMESQRRQQTLTIVGHSDAVRDVLELCNLSRFFGDPVLIPSNDSKEH